MNKSESDIDLKRQNILRTNSHTNIAYTKNDQHVNNVKDLKDMQSLSILDPIAEKVNKSSMNIYKKPRAYRKEFKSNLYFEHNTTPSNLRQSILFLKTKQNQSIESLSTYAKTVVTSLSNYTTKNSQQNSPSKIVKSNSIVGVASRKKHDKFLFEDKSVDEDNLNYVYDEEHFKKMDLNQLKNMVLDYKPPKRKLKEKIQIKSCITNEVDRQLELATYDCLKDSVNKRNTNYESHSRISRKFGCIVEPHKFQKLQADQKISNNLKSHLQYLNRSMSTKDYYKSSKNYIHAISQNRLCSKYTPDSRNNLKGIKISKNNSVTILKTENNLNHQLINDNKLTCYLDAMTDDQKLRFRSKVLKEFIGSMKEELRTLSERIMPDLKKSHHLKSFDEYFVELKTAAAKYSTKTLHHDTLVRLMTCFAFRYDGDIKLNLLQFAYSLYFHTTNCDTDSVTHTLKTVINMVPTLPWSQADYFCDVELKVTEFIVDKNNNTITANQPLTRKSNRNDLNSNGSINSLGRTNVNVLDERVIVIKNAKCYGKRLSFSDNDYEYSFYIEQDEKIEGSITKTAIMKTTNYDLRCVSNLPERRVYTGKMKKDKTKEAISIKPKLNQLLNIDEEEEEEDALDESLSPKTEVKEKPKVIPAYKRLATFMNAQFKKKLRKVFKNNVDTKLTLKLTNFEYCVSGARVIQSLDYMFVDENLGFQAREVLAGIINKSCSDKIPLTHTLLYDNIVDHYIHNKTQAETTQQASYFMSYNGYLYNKDSNDEKFKEQYDLIEAIKKYLDLFNKPEKFNSKDIDKEFRTKIITGKYSGNINTTCDNLVFVDNIAKMELDMQQIHRLKQIAKKSIPDIVDKMF